jgi:peptidoglycan/LPS O-acetylase OafA/YrhL
LRYVKSLDGLRGVAVLMVLVMHAALATPTGGRDVLDVHALSVLRYGGLGVDCFFVLSGFLITGILLAARGSAAPGRVFGVFYARRALRIFPIYYLYLAVLALTVVDSVQEVRELTSLATYTQNFFWLSHRSTMWALVGHLWSLAIEEHFYLVWPFVVLLAPLRRLPLIIAVSVACVIGLRIVAKSQGWGDFLYLSTPTRMDSLLLGSLLASLHAGAAPRLRAWYERNRDRLTIGCFVVYASAQAISGLHAGNLFNVTLGFTIFAVGCCGIIDQLASGRGPFRAPFEQRHIVAIGRISYGVYLYHLPVFFGVRLVFLRYLAGWQSGSYLVDFAAYLLVATAVTALLASFSFRFIEQPMLRMKPGFTDPVGQGEPLPRTTS